MQEMCFVGLGESLYLVRPLVLKEAERPVGMRRCRSGARSRMREGSSAAQRTGKIIKALIWSLSAPIVFPQQSWLVHHSCSRRGW